MKRFCLTVGVLVCSLVLSGLADEGRERTRFDVVAVFEHNIRLDFNTIPQTESAEGLFIVTATPEFESNTVLDGEKSDLNFAVHGRIDELEDERIFVQFGIHLFVGSEEGQAEFDVNSGVLLKPGQEMEVAQLGDRVLVIKYTSLKALKENAQDESDDPQA